MTPFIICLKRNLKSAFVWIVIIIMPLIALGYNALGNNISKKPAVGMYFDCENSSIFENMDYDTIDFITYTSKDKMTEDISLGKIDSGYVFDDKFDKAVESLDFKKSIDYIVSSSSALQPVANEFIFGKILNKISPEIANKYFDYEISADKYYNEIFKGDTVFNITFEETGNNKSSTDESNFKISNVFSVFVLIGTIMTAINVIKDRKKGIAIYGFTYIFSSAFIFMLSAIAAMIICNEFKIKSIPLYILFMLSSALLSYIISFFKREEIVCGILPVITLLSFVICPVIFDIGSLNSYYGYIGYILPVTYFVKSAVYSIGIYTLILAVLAYLLKRRNLYGVK